MNIFFVFSAIIILIVIVYYILENKTFVQKGPVKFLGLGAIFKNEGHILKEWIEHYKDEEVDHIYLVNDHSTDDYFEILEPYINEGYVTLYHVPNDLEKQQRWAVSNIFQKHADEYEWFMHLDLDEFMTSRDAYTVRRKLKEYFSNYNCIFVPWLMFGSNGLEKHPKSSIQSYTRRMKFQNHPELENFDNINGKSIYRKHKMNIHHPSKEIPIYLNFAYSNLELKVTHFDPILDYSEESLKEYHLVINHYRLQSKEFWQTKIKRGDSNGFGDYQNRCLQKFELLDKYYNEIEDVNLRNKTIKRRGLS